MDISRQDQRRSKPGTRRQTAPVAERTISTHALRVALELAGGDRSRLRFEKDGTVTVANTPRVSTRPH